MKKDIPKIDWLRVFSPAVLGMAFSIVAVIVSYTEKESSGGWSILGVIAFVPVLLMLLALNILVKFSFKEKTGVIWLVELLALVLIYILWVSRFT